MTIECFSELRCHPATAGDLVREIHALVRRSQSAIEIVFRLEGDVSRIRVPPACGPRVASKLWQHTCFEAFIAVEGEPAYIELNFAPSGEWAAYAFRGYRDPAPLAEGFDPPEIEVRATDRHLELDASVSLDRWVAFGGNASLRLGLSAVIEGDDGRLSYWALRHGGDQPDFHDASAFALRLDPLLAE